jgi:hypothetical protein
MDMNAQMNLGVQLFFGVIVVSIIMAIIAAVASGIDSRDRKEVTARIVSINRNPPYGLVVAEWTDPATGSTYRYSARPVFSQLGGYKVNSPIRVRIKPDNPLNGNIVV